MVEAFLSLVRYLPYNIMVVWPISTTEWRLCLQITRKASDINPPPPGFYQQSVQIVSTPSLYPRPGIYVGPSFKSSNRPNYFEVVTFCGRYVTAANVAWNNCLRKNI